MPLSSIDTVVPLLKLTFQFKIAISGHDDRTGRHYDGQSSSSNFGPQRRGGSFKRKTQKKGGYFNPRRSGLSPVYLVLPRLDVC